MYVTSRSIDLNLINYAQFANFWETKYTKI
jgi:hypothetical protein